MKEYIRVEIGRTKKANNEVIVEIGRKETDISEISNFKEGTVIELDRKAKDPIDLFTNGELAAKGNIVVVDENFAVKVTDILDDKYDILNLFAINNIIELDRKSYELADVFTNEKLIAKGAIVIIGDLPDSSDFTNPGENNFGIKIVEIIKVD